MPTKTEQTDLLLAMFGRHGESPLPIVAASSPADCFATAMEAARIAVRYRTPVILLSDTFLSNSQRAVEDARGRRPARRSIRTSRRPTATGSCPTPATSGSRARGRCPGTPGLVHRIGGLEREVGTGNISYDPANHERMTYLRRDKVEGIAARHPAARGRRSRRRRRAARAGLGLLARHDPGGRPPRPRRRAHGGDRAPAAPQPVPVQHGRGRPPLPEGADPRDEPRAARRCSIRARFLVDARGFNKVQGLPIVAEELEQEILRVLDE